MRTARVVAAVLALVLAFAAATAWALPRPQPLPQQDGCELWRGSISGNDASALAELRICPRGDALAGQLQWSSTTSGYSVRELEGTRRGTHVVLHDTRFAQYRPANGWRFCLVDQYTLEQNGDTMTGGYVSEACFDHARVTLHRVRAAGASQ